MPKSQRMNEGALLNKIADGQIYAYQQRLIQVPAQKMGDITGPSGAEILTGISPSEWGMVKASMVKRMKREQAVIRREMDREFNGLPGLFEAIEEAEK